MCLPPLQLLSKCRSECVSSSALHVMHQSIETPAPRPPDTRGIAGDSGDLTRLMRGFNTHLTTCCPRESVELTRYSFDPGHERGFNTHAMDVFFLGFRQKRPLTKCSRLLLFKMADKPKRERKEPKRFSNKYFTYTARRKKKFKAV